MTALAITKKSNGAYAIFAGKPLDTLSPHTAMVRVDKAMSWLLGQPAPHEVVLDDPTGIAGVLVTAWLMTNAYPCNVTFRRADGMPVCSVGIWQNGHAFVNAYNTEENNGKISASDQAALDGHEAVPRPAEQTRH